MGYKLSPDPGTLQSSPNNPYDWAGTMTAIYTSHRVQVGKALALWLSEGNLWALHPAHRHGG